MWWWVVPLLALTTDTLSSQPVTDEEKYHQARELGIDCCPCSGSGTLESGLRLAGDQDVDASGLRVLDALPENVQGRLNGRDDCPCRFRPEDSEGSSSIFLPRVLRPHRPIMTPSDSKEDPKPLLKPEVKLASSVLDTLKEVTEEEYEDALARDAAKAAAQESEALFNDNTSDDGSKVVNIFVNRDNEDALVPEATNVQESRCAHPLKSTFKGRILESKPFVTLRKFEPKSYFRGSDIHNDASNINENKVSIKGLEALHLKTSPSILNLFPGGLKPIINRSHGKNVLKIPKLNLITYKSVDDNDCRDSKRLLKLPKIPDFKISKLESFDESNDDANLGINKFSSAQIPSFGSRFSNDMDSNHSPSNINEQLIEVDIDNNHHRMQFKSPLRNLNLRPLRLSNLLKLKDVELLPPAFRKVTKVNIPSLELPPIKPREQIRNENTSDTSESSDEALNVNSKENDIKTKVLDTVPSASEQKVVIQPTTNTQILNSVPNKTEIVNEASNQNFSPLNKNQMATESNAEKERGGFINPSKINEEAIIFEDGDTNTIIIIDENGKTTTYGNFYNEMDQSNYIDEQSIQSDYEDSEETKVDPEAVVIDGLSLDSETDTSNTDFQFALPSEVEDDYDENFTEQELRSQPDTNETTTVSSLTVVNDRLQKIKEQIANRIENIKSKLATPSIQTKSNNINEGEINNISKQPENSNCGCKTASTVTTDNMSTTETSNELQLTQANDVTETPTGEVTEYKELSELREPSHDFTTQSNNLFEVCCTNNFTETKKSNEQEHDESDEEEEVTETNVTTEDQEEQPEHTTNTSDITTTEITPDATSDNIPSNGNIVSNKDNDFTNLQDESQNIKIKGAEHKTNEENLCNINLHDQEKPTQEKTQDDQTSEMSVGGSAPEPNILPTPFLPALRPSTFNNGIVQPTSLISNNAFDNPLPGISELLNLNTQLPSLDDVRSGIANALGLNSRNADKFEGAECERAEEESDSNQVMSAEASTNNGKSVFPALRPLEDLNLDIFQIRPLTQSRLPGLDLNSFKTRFAFPKNLGLKPVKLQSSLGRNGGLLGATLTFGPDKIGTSRKSSSAFTRKGSSTQSSPSLFVIRNLSELRDKMRSNAEDLLSSSPLTIPTISLPSAPSLGSLHENLRAHTENTMRNLQHSLASTLHEAKIKQEKYAKPMDALEDFNEKLQALHMDFNDRLTSIHERIFDKSKLPTLRLPLFQEPRNVEPTKPIKASNFRVNKPQPNKIKEHRNIKPFKISKAASSLTPKSVEVPKLVTTSIKPPVFKPLQREVNVNLKGKRPVTHSTESNRRPSLREQYEENRENIKKSFLENEQKSKSNFEKTSENIKNNLKNLGQRRKLQDSHGFASELTQTRIPAPVNLESTPLMDKLNNLKEKSFSGIKSEIHLPKLTIKEPLLKVAENTNKDIDLTAKKPALPNRPTIEEPKRQSLDDSSGLPSENTSKDLLKKTTTVKQKTLPALSQRIPLPKLPKTSLPALPKAKELNPIGQRLPNSIKPKLLEDLKKESTSTKTTESPFLTRVRETLKSRVSNLNKPLKPKSVIQSPNNDMTISATENREVAVLGDQPLKENVQYRCKMICVKEPAK